MSKNICGGSSEFAFLLGLSGKPSISLVVLIATTVITNTHASAYKVISYVNFNNTFKVDRFVAAI